MESTPTTKNIAISMDLPEEQIIREVNFLMQTTAVPKELQQRPQEVHTIVQLAHQYNMLPVQLLKHSFFIKGKVAFEQKVITALLNSSRKLDRPLTFLEDENSCQAIGYIQGHEYRSIIITREMAKQARWGPLWNTIFNQMARYRAAAYFVRSICPEIMLGIDIKEEVEDVGYKTQPDPNDFQESYIEGEEI